MHGLVQVYIVPLYSFHGSAGYEYHIVENLASMKFGELEKKVIN